MGPPKASLGWPFLPRFQGQLSHGHAEWVRNGDAWGWDTSLGDFSPAPCRVLRKMRLHLPSSLSWVPVSLALGSHPAANSGDGSGDLGGKIHILGSGSPKAVGESAGEAGARAEPAGGATQPDQSPARRGSRSPKSPCGAGGIACSCACVRSASAGGHSGRQAQTLALSPGGCEGRWASPGSAGARLGHNGNAMASGEGATAKGPAAWAKDGRRM